MEQAPQEAPKALQTSTFLALINIFKRPFVTSQSVQQGSKLVKIPMRLPFVVPIALACCVSAAAADTIRGRPSVTDGDTLEIAGKRIRLHGVDAPESSQTCKDWLGMEYRCG